MRDFLNGILSFIGTATLTDNEFDSLTIESAAYDSATYTALSEVLEVREAISTVQDRLANYFLARGVSITVADTGKSNIFLGGDLSCS